MRPIDSNSVQDLPTNEIVTLLERGDFSLLKLFGAEKLQQEMKKIGKACNLFIWLTFWGIPKNPSPAQIKKCYKRGRRILRIFFPDKEIGVLPDTSAGTIIGFNHPTLHDILSLISFSLKHFPGKKCCFPTNLPWGEALAIHAPRLRQLGIYVSPLITNPTLEKIRKCCNNSPEIMPCRAKNSKKAPRSLWQSRHRIHI